MPIYFYSAAAPSAELMELEKRIRHVIPNLKKVSSIEELTKSLPEKNSLEVAALSHVVFPFSPQAHSSFDRLVDIASKYRKLLFFIFISDDISANDYKRLVRTGGADWVSSRASAREILDIVTRSDRAGAASMSAPESKPAIISFVPSAGGVGNSTIAIEAALQIKIGKETQDRRVCLIDLDFQTSHVCDLLDLEPRLNIEEFARHPERLDTQLFEQFVSHHSTGLDLVAAPKSKNVQSDLSIAALDALFGMISKRYDLVLVDLPVAWMDWTRQILNVTDTAIVVGLITIPSLRQVSDALQAIRNLEHVPSQIVVALNRTNRRFLGGIAGSQFVKKILKDESIVHVREDAAMAHQSINTGIPLTVMNPSGKVTKDIAKLSALLTSSKVM